MPACFCLQGVRCDICEIMELHVSPKSRLESVLFRVGWAARNEQVPEVARWLSDQGVKEERDLVGLEITDLKNLQKWEPEVATNSASLVHVHVFMHLVCRCAKTLRNF